MKSEIRKDYIEDSYVIIAPGRAKRPQELEAQAKKPTKKKGKCVLCPKNIPEKQYVARFGSKPWKVAIIENIYPAVSLDNDKAYGKQEVVIETSDPVKQLDELSESHIKELLDSYAVRTEEIQQIDKINYILIFKNAGGRAGASIEHAHSQIFATELVPPHLIDKSKRMTAYRKKNKRCVYCDILRKEAKSARRIYSDRHVVAFAPYASEHQYEVWILPRKHRDNITELTEAERKSWAKAMKKILSKISKLGLSYNYYFHQVIRDPDQHLYMKITPRASVWAGVEISTGVIINAMPPEEAAKYYRK